MAPIEEESYNKIAVHTFEDIVVYESRSPHCSTNSCHVYNIKLQETCHSKHECKGIVQEKAKCYVEY